MSVTPPPWSPSTPVTRPRTMQHMATLQLEHALATFGASLAHAEMFVQKFHALARGATMLTATASHLHEESGLNIVTLTQLWKAIDTVCTAVTRVHTRC